MIKTLYIIGNGFDINLGIKSRYSDFQDFYANHKFEIIKKLGIPPIEIKGQKYAEYSDNPNSIPVTKWKLTPLDFLYSAYEGFFDTYGLEEKDDYWWSFESSLSDVDVFSIGQHYISEDGNVTYRYNKEGLNDLKQNLDDSYRTLNESVKQWTLQIKLPNKHLVIPNSDSSYFFTFNFTLTLEKMFDIPSNSIHHVHGSVDDPSSIKIGSDTPIDYMPTEFITGTYPIFEEYFNRIKKHPRDRMNDFKKKIKEQGISLIDVDTIVVLGHSFNEVDWHYFFVLKKMCKVSAKWIVSIYTNEDKERFESMIKKMGVSTSNIKTIGYIDEYIKESNF